MRRFFQLFIILVVTLFVLTTYGCSRGCSRPSTPTSTINVEIKLLTNDGGHPDWHGDIIAFDKRTGAQGIFEIYTMKSDGSNVECLTCNKSSAPSGHKGMPAFSPDGKWIAFSAENEYGNNEPKTIPGRGNNNDLWIMTSDGNKYYRMTNLPKDDGGILHPHFSYDGEKLTWTEMYERPKLTLSMDKIFGSWKLKIADFSVVNDVPRLTNIMEYIPGDDVFYENHGLSPDGQKWIFSSNFKSGDSVFKHMNIFTMDMSTKAITQLTTTNYNEHAYYSPNGAKISWMQGPAGGSHQSDLWLMNSDGSDKTRLTYFNDSSSQQFMGKTGMVGDNSWNDEGDKIVFVFLSGTDNEWNEGLQEEQLYILSFV